METEQLDTGFWHGAYQEHGPAILSFLRSRSRSPDDAEELMQETFVRAIRSGESVRDPSKIRSFLFTTAHNLLRNQQRRAAVSPISQQPPPDAAAAGTTDERAQASQLAQRLETVLLDMSPAHRAAFTMGVLERRPYREIAEQLGWSLSAVKVNVYRARKHIIDEFGNDFPMSGGNS